LPHGAFTLQLAAARRGSKRLRMRRIPAAQPLQRTRFARSRAVAGRCRTNPAESGRLVREIFRISDWSFGVSSLLITSRNGVEADGWQHPESMPRDQSGHAQDGCVGSTDRSGSGVRAAMMDQWLQVQVQPEVESRARHPFGDDRRRLARPGRRGDHSARRLGRRSLRLGRSAGRSRRRCRTLQPPPVGRTL